jgi:hypothetical protein
VGKTVQAGWHISGCFHDAPWPGLLN